jgi:hypothetical protein
MTKRVLLAGLLGGIAMFAWTSLAHIVLPIRDRPWHARRHCDRRFLLELVRLSRHLHSRVHDHRCRQLHLRGARGSRGHVGAGSGNDGGCCVSSVLHRHGSITTFIESGAIALCTAASTSRSGYRWLTNSLSG